MTIQKITGSIRTFILEDITPMRARDSYVIGIKGWGNRIITSNKPILILRITSGEATSESIKARAEPLILGDITKSGAINGSSLRDADSLRF